MDDLLAQNNVVDKNADESDIVLQRIDTTTGSVIACAIAWFIIITTGAVLYPAGIQVADAADAALALEPIAGEFATVLFAAGLVAASLAACVLPGVTSSAIARRSIGSAAPTAIERRPPCTARSSR